MHYKQNSYRGWIKKWPRWGVLYDNFQRSVSTWRFSPASKKKQKKNSGNQRMGIPILCGSDVNRNAVHRGGQPRDATVLLRADFSRGTTCGVEYHRTPPLVSDEESHSFQSATCCVLCVQSVELKSAEIHRAFRAAPAWRSAHQRGAEERSGVALSRCCPTGWVGWLCDVT